MIFLSETDKNIKFFSESKNDKNELFIEGITLVANIKNANNRIYPKKILKEAIQKHSEEFLKTGGAVGELNHPLSDPSQINFDRVSHRFLEVWEDDNNFITKAKVLNTISGKQVKNLYEGGVRLGLSSRAFGDVRQDNGTAIIESLYLVSLGDIVANPSAPGAFVNAVIENKEFLWENGNLVSKNIEETLTDYKKIIHKSKKRDRKILFVNIFNDYMNKILNRN